MGNFLEKMVPVTSSQRFSFQCKRCGACCRHIAESVPLESLDVYRIAKHLKEKGKVSCVDDVLEKYAESVLLDEYGYMTFVLKTIGSEAACIFLKNDRCSIHEVKPRACRTYPIEISPGEQEKYEKFLSMDYPHHFNGPQRSVEKWIRRYFTEEDQKFFDCDTGFVIRIARMLRQIPEREIAHAINLFIYYKYEALELEKPFMEQFEENNKKLVVALGKMVQEPKE